MLQHVNMILTELFAEQCWIPVLLPRVLLGDENPGRLEARQPGGRGHVDVAVIAIPHHHPLPEVPTAKLQSGARRFHNHEEGPY